MSWKYFGFIDPIYIAIILARKSEMVTLGQIVATNTVYKTQHSFVVLKLFVCWPWAFVIARDMVRSMLCFCDARGQALETL